MRRARIALLRGHQGNRRPMIWITLLGAILAEVTATVSLRIASGGKGPGTC